jgi:transposase
MLARTFGCVRVVWNGTLAARHARWATERKPTSYRETDAALTAMKRLPELAWLNEVSSVPLQQTLRHQHKAFAAFFAGRARYPRYKSRRGRQAATYTRSAFRWRDGQLTLAKMTSPMTLVWSWPAIDPATLDERSHIGVCCRHRAGGRERRRAMPRLVRSTATPLTRPPQIARSLDDVGPKGRRAPIEAVSTGSRIESSVVPLRPPSQLAESR